MIITDFLDKETFLLFSVLVLVAMAALLSERAGIINIALEGQLIGAVLGYTSFNFLLKENGVSDAGRYFFGLFGALLVTLIVTLVFAFFVINLKLNQILVALAINIIMFGMASFVIIYIKNDVQLVLREDYVWLYLSDSFKTYWVFGTSGVAIIWQFFFVLLLIPLLYFFLFYTKTGLHIRACGESVKVSMRNNISVVANRYLALFLGGILVAFAGSFFAEARVSFSGGVDGYGYLGLAMLILGSRNLGLISFFTAIFVILQTFILSLDPKHQELLNIFNYLLPLIFLAFYGVFWSKKVGRNAVPHDLGK